MTLACGQIGAEEDSSGTMIDYSKLQRSLKHLEQQFANHQLAQARPELSELDRAAIAESVIQRFETCYDTLWKVLKRHLVDQLGLADVPASPKPILRLAGQNDLLPSPVAQWLQYAHARIDTAHDYSGDKAAGALQIVGTFLADAVSLYEKMTGTTWA